MGIEFLGPTAMDEDSDRFWSLYLTSLELRAERRRLVAEARVQCELAQKVRLEVQRVRDAPRPAFGKRSLVPLWNKTTSS